MKTIRSELAPLRPGRTAAGKNVVDTLSCIAASSVGDLDRIWRKDKLRSKVFRFQTSEKESRWLAELKLGAAESLEQRDLVALGTVGVCLVADNESCETITGRGARR